MERLNKITLAEQMKPAPKPIPVYLSVRANGFGLSVGLYSLMKEPTHVEFAAKGKALYLLASDPDHGFMVTSNKKASNHSFSCKPVCVRFFKGEKQRAIVFTMPVELEFEGGGKVIGYEVKLI